MRENHPHQSTNKMPILKNFDFDYRRDYYTTHYSRPEYAKCPCLISYCTKHKSLIHCCLLCKGRGGTYGNVVHKYDCKYKNCMHEDERAMRGVTYWKDMQEEIRQRENHNENLKTNILKCCKEIDKKLENKIKKILELKTNKSFQYNDLSGYLFDINTSSTP